MKHIFCFTSILVLAFSTTYSQTISPIEANEFCPNVNTTFTVSGLPGTINSVVSFAGGCQVVQGASSNTAPFNFVGRFSDANLKQTYRVNYTSNNTSLFKDFNFFKIKSLRYGSNSAISPNQINIIAPRCQVSNFSISFNNV
jgi:hypothetical protein